MAYDPNDPADKKIVADLVKTATDELTTEHEAEITGLKVKNTELLAKIKKGDTNPEELAAVENELEKTKAELKVINKEHKKVLADLTETKQALDGETKVTQKLVGENGLTAALAKVGVAPQFMDAVKALLSPQVQVKIDGDNRKAVVGDKPLEAFVTEWAQGDTGKNFIAAANNSGTGAPGGIKPGNTGGKTISRAAFEALPVHERGPALAGGVTLTD